MPRGASRLGGGGSSKAPRRARNGGVGVGDSTPPELAGVVGRCETVMLDDEDIEAIADRVAAKLRLPTDGLVGVRDVARALGMSRAWVYRNADALGAQRLGGGRKPALRFDLARTLERAVALGFPAQPIPKVATSRRRGRAPNAKFPVGVELIAPRGGRRP
jgi:hypothetical protein